MSDDKFFDGRNVQEEFIDNLRKQLHETEEALQKSRHDNLEVLQSK